MIHVFQPQLGREELAAVGRVFASNWVGKGRLTQEFEARLAERFGTRAEQVCSVSCCTAGLRLIAELLQWGPGDEVLLPTISFVGAANAVAARGARPVFTDVDSQTLNPRLDDILGRVAGRTKGVILLHYGGVPCAEIDAIAEYCRDRQIALVEDNACSPFAEFQGRACGTWGDFGVWSFDAMKILVTGDGGLIHCRQAEDANRLERMAYLGLESASGYANESAERWWEFEISSFGGREIMNDVSAAIGLEQLNKIDRFLQHRPEVHDVYDREFAALGWLTTPPPIPADSRSCNYLYWVQTDRRDELAGWLRERGIYTTFKYHPLHRVRRYESEGRLPHAERAAAETLCLPLHQGLSEQDVAKVVDCVKRFPYR